MNALINNYKITFAHIEINYFYRSIPGIIEIKIPLFELEKWIRSNIPDVYEECLSPQITDMTNSDESLNVVQWQNYIILK